MKDEFLSKFKFDNFQNRLKNVDSIKIVVDTRVELFININSNFNFENIFQIFEKSDVDSNIKIRIDAWDLFKTLFQFFPKVFSKLKFLLNR